MRFLAVLFLVLLLPRSSPAQESNADFAAAATRRFDIVADVTYSRASGVENKLDVFHFRDTSVARPVVINIHGGGWTGGTKDEEYLNLLPYLEMGFNAVNVEYRLADVALAPAAVADARCALRWVYANARRFGFDTSKIVVTGRSAGGHLALTTGMLPQEAGLDFECSQGPHGRELSVAAIVNFYGITDVNDLLFGKPNEKSYAVRWLGAQEDIEEIARRVSPLSYVRRGLPPVLTIHGDSDPTVPYEHALRLKAALTAAGVPNQLHTVIGGGHGGFSPEQSVENHKAIRAFLKENGIQ